MLSNPETLNTILESPQLKPMLDQNPMMRAMFSNPQFLQMMLNPQTLQNAMNVMQGGGMNFGSNNPFPGLFGGNLNQNQQNQQSSTSSTGTSQEVQGGTSNQDQATTGTSTSTNQNNLFNPFSFLQGGQGMNPFFMNPNLNNSITNEDPKEKYKQQNQQLKDMGFINDDANIEALVKTFGNVDAAVERLLNMLK
jgi:ubiquilin